MIYQILDEMEMRVDQLNPTQTTEPVKQWLKEQINLIRTIQRETDKANEELDYTRVR